MGIFSSVINELKRVPTDIEQDDYDNIDLEDEAEPDQSSEDNYELPDNEEETEQPEDQDPQEEPQEDDNYELPDEGDDTNDNPEEDLDQTDNLDTPTTEEDSELQSLEDEIFQGLRDSEKAIRDRELLSLYTTMYNDINSILNKLGGVPKTEKIIQPLEYCTNKLTDLREILFSYILSTYNLKTYIENMTNYYEFLATIQAINKILSELKEKDDNKD